MTHCGHNKLITLSTISARCAPTHRPLDSLHSVDMDHIFGFLHSFLITSGGECQKKIWLRWSLVVVVCVCVWGGEEGGGGEPEGKNSAQGAQAPP